MRSGTFVIVPFDVEQQFLNANTQALKTVANTSQGSFGTLETIPELMETLINDDRYKPVQKSKENIVPLIDWKWLLGVLVLLLSSEWFLRKYHGLI